RNQLVGILEKGALEKDGRRRRKLLTIVVAGGGCTGVEVVTEIAQFINIILDKDYPELERSELRILLIEAMDKILPSFPRYLSQVATKRLKWMGIEILLNSPIQWATEDSIGLEDGKEIPFGILVWTGGVKAGAISLGPEVKRDRSGRIIVDGHLEIPGYPGIFAIGDGAHFRQNGDPLPPTASVAVQEARYVAQKLLLGMKEREIPPFHFNCRGDMASLGFMFGVAEVYGRHFKGFIAWILWKLFKLAMLPRYKTRFQIVADWLITLAFRRDTSKLT
ncbi:MAG: FAD-dependent oxidoreductase, partial [Deltaproteobacteria bacterium]|nr:FAD-dependent oxidoreductase [Deltaproteobacteria bacterium]